MDTKCTNSFFDVALCDKSEVNLTSEYTLTEYMQGIKKIVKTNAKVRVLEKVISDGNVIIGGDVVFNVLYIAENGGLLKNAVFKEPFDVRFDKDLNEDEECKYFISVKTSPVTVSSKNTGMRLITSKARFTLFCEVYSFSGENGCLDDSRMFECGIEVLRRDLERSKMEICEGIKADISEEIKIDEGAPEISDIIFSDMDACINSVSVSDGALKVFGKARFNCLYEAKHDDLTEYISLDHEIPFESEIDMPCVDSEWDVCVSAEVDSVPVNVLSDDYGEQRIIEVSSNVVLCATALCNNKCTVITDMYSTNKSITPIKEKQRILQVIDKYPTEAIYKDKVHIDLRGITDIVSNSLELSFSPPEFTDGATFVPAKGVLSVLGIKENGEADSQSTQVSMRIPIKNIPYEIFMNKLKWVCNTYICSYDCSLTGGELSLNLTIDGSAIALSEENVEVITSYEINENDDAKTGKGGFSLYYATKGESVWDVAKKHGVSYERIKKDNAINTISFEKDTAVILR